MITKKTINDFIDTNRSKCLWYMDKNYYPSSDAEYIKILKSIESHANLSVFKQAKELESWLLQNTKKQSVD